MDIINPVEIAQRLSQVELFTDGVQDNVKRLMKSIDLSITGHRILVSHGFLPLVGIATEIKAWELGGGQTVILRIPWSERTKARSLYGSVFPAEVFRLTVVENGGCDGPMLIKIYRFKHDGNTVELQFYRETFEGDKVDGCEVKMIEEKYREPDYSRYFRNQSLSLVCSIQGKK